MTNRKRTENFHFTSGIGFIAATTGAAVGVSNIWKFPYEVGQNGGARYLLIYGLIVLIFGLPMVLAKSAFGRRVGNGIYASYQDKGYWSLIGLLSCIVCMLAFSFYTVVLSWFLGYGIAVLNGNLFAQTDMAAYFAEYTRNVSLNALYHVIICVVTMAIIRLGVQQGIEKIAKILMPLFMLMLVSMIVYALCLKGSSKGIHFYLYPNVRKFSLASIPNALAQAFFSLTLGTGVIVTYGAYAQKTTNLVENSFSIVVADFLVAFLAGLLIFPLVFCLSDQSVKTTQGTALVFMVLPPAFKHMGIIQGTLMGVSFFFLLVVAGITSAISQLEIPTKYIMERFGFSRKKSVILVGLCCYLMGIPSLLAHGGSSLFTHFITIRGKHYDFMTLIIKVLTLYMMPLVAMLFCIFIGKHWKEYGMDKEINTPKKYSKNFLLYIRYCVTYLAPLLIFIVVITSFIIG